MCELFALSFSEPIGPTYFRSFLKRCLFNPDGWGIAWYPDKAVQLFKEPFPGGTSQLASVISTSSTVQSCVYVAHVRKTNSSVVAHENTHPFHRELFSRDFVFAHNGNVTSLKALPTGHFRSVGRTDSEHAFCRLLSSLEERSHWTGTILDIQQLAAEMEEINRFGKFSCLLSDGDLLICRRDAGGANGLLLLTSRIGTSSGVVIASEPLSSEKWESFQPGELMAFRKGSLVYSSSGRRGL